ncbi:hypothetical protein C0J52_11551 [Blattella germanica]|nr:hypothetical protein C0J52_11551 [Blattella germanica]
MPKNRLPQILLEYQPRGKRRVGRPLTRLKPTVSDDWKNHQPYLIVPNQIKFRGVPQLHK